MKRRIETPVVIHLTASAVYTVVLRPSKSDEKVSIAAVGIANTQDFRNGKILHRDRLINAIKKSISQAEEFANVRIYSVTLCFSSPDIRSDNQVAHVRIDGDCVGNEHMAAALLKAKSQFLKNDEHLVQFSRLITWLGNDEYQDAVGMKDVRTLEIGFHLIGMNIQQFDSIHHLFQSCDITVDHVVFGMVAGAEYALIPEERERGVLFIDIGRDLTNIAVYKENKLIFSKCLAVGAHMVTMDISSEIHVSLEESERLKRQHATLDFDDSIKHDFRHTETTTIHTYRLCQVVEARYRLLFQQVFSELQQVGIDQRMFPAGVVLAGGGAQIDGIVPYLRKQGMPVHLTNKNDRIEIDPRLLKEGKIDKHNQLKSNVTNRQLQTALGAMIYHLSEDFDYQQRVNDATEGGDDTPITRFIDWFQSKIAQFTKVV